MIDDARLPKKKLFLEYFSQLPIQELGANFIGVAENTITNWKKEDQDFCDCIDRAKSQWAMDNAKRVRSKEWLLERVMSNHFKERKQVEVNIPTPLLGEDDVQKDNSPQETTATE